MTWPRIVRPSDVRPFAVQVRQARARRRGMHAPARVVPTIAGVTTAVPEHVLSQADVKRAIAGLLDVPPARREGLGALFDNVLVDTRHSVLPVDELRRPRSLSQTTALYREHAVALGLDVARRCLHDTGVRADDVDLVITTSCTGFMIPSLDAHICNQLGFRPDVRRLPITELGCVAGAAALSRARDFLLGHPGARVLLVSVELPTLGFQRGDASTANLVSTALFGDGAAAAMMVGKRGPGIAVLDTEAHLFPATMNALGYELRDTGFHVVLSKELPALVRAHIGGVVERLTRRAGLSPADLSFFLLHPGGRKILAALEEALGLHREDTDVSWDVMRTHGNLSSATVFFILRAWLDRGRPALGTRGLLGGFGPGFSAELLLLQCT